MKRQYVGTQLEGLEKEKEEEEEEERGMSSRDIRRLVTLNIVTARNIETKTP